MVFYKKAVLTNIAIFKGKHLCMSLFLIKLKAFRPATLLKRDSNTGLFSCGYCQNFKNTYFEEHLRTAAFLYARFNKLKSEFFENNALKKS